jgi:AraC-like DNA-binding protein
MSVINYELTENGVPVPFVVRTMEEIDAKNQGRADKAHRHSFYTIIWSLEATGYHTIDFKTYRIEPGSIFFVRPGQIHQVITDSDPEGFVLLFTNEFLAVSGISPSFIDDLRVFNQCDENPPFYPGESIQGKLKMMVKGMHDVCSQERLYKYESLGAYLKLFLIECNLSFNTASNQNRSDAGGTLLRQFKNHVEDYFSKIHKVNEYAARLHISPNHLNETVKKYLGKTAKEYIQDRIILEAKRLILFSGMSSKEIAYDLGFEDPSHFSKFFKNCEGISIAEFKEAH